MKSLETTQTSEIVGVVTSSHIISFQFFQFPDTSKPIWKM